MDTKAWPLELTAADRRCVDPPDDLDPDEGMQDKHAIKWPDDFTREKKITVLKRLRSALLRWKEASEKQDVIEANGLGEDYVVLNQGPVYGVLVDRGEAKPVEAGTIREAISVSNVAMMLAEPIFRDDVSVDSLASYSEEKGYGLDEDIRKPRSFYHFLKNP